MPESKAKSEAKKASKKKASKKKVSKKSSKSERTSYLIKKKAMREYVKTATDASIGTKFYSDVNERLVDWINYIMQHVAMLVDKKCKGAMVSKEMLQEAIAVAVRKEFVATIDKTYGKKYLLVVSEANIRSVMKSEISSRVTLEAVVYMSHALIQRFHEIVKEEISLMKKQDKSRLNVCYSKTKKTARGKTQQAATPDMEADSASDIAESSDDGSDWDF